MSKDYKREFELACVWLADYSGNCPRNFFEDTGRAAPGLPCCDCIAEAEEFTHKAIRCWRRFLTAEARKLGVKSRR